MISKKWSLPLIFLSGLGFAISHAPFNLPLIAMWFLPIAAWLSLQTRRKYWAGYLFGFGFFIVTMSWISEPFAVGPPEYARMAFPAWVLMAAGLSLFWIPLFRFTDQGVWSVALIFGIMEYLRGHIFTGLPWALFAYGFVDFPIRDLSALIGSYGLSAALALLVLLVTDFRKVPSLASAVAIMVISAAYIVLRPEPSDESLKDYQVRAIQPNFEQAERWSQDQLPLLNENIALSRGDESLVVWPEGSTFIPPTQDPGLLPYINAQLPGKTVIFGAPSYDDNLYFNSAYELRPDGEFYRYDKQHLVPFGEYIPFGDWLLERGIATQTVTLFSARKGQMRPYPEFDGPRPNILICYEGIFPAMGRREGDFIVLITNDIWFGTRSGPFHHLASARFRATENGQPLVRSALTGISAIINADGEVIESLGMNQKGAISGALGMKYENTVYRRVGDWPFLILSGFGLAWLVIAKRRAKR